MSSINDALRKADSDPRASAATQVHWPHRPPFARRSLAPWSALGLIVLLIIIGVWSFRPDGSKNDTTSKTTKASSTRIEPAVGPETVPDRPFQAPPAPVEEKTAVLDQPQSKPSIPAVPGEEMKPASVPVQAQSPPAGRSEGEPAAESQAKPGHDTIRPQETDQSAREVFAAAQAEEQQTKADSKETKPPATAEDHFRKARAAQEQGRDSQAVHHYRQALLLDPRLTEAYLNLGNIYFFRHRALEKALEMYTQVLKLDPNNEMAHNNLGVLFLRKGMPGQAETEFYAALQKNPGYVDALYNLACLAALKNETETALDYLARAAAIQPETVVWAAGDEDLKSLRRLPRFKKLLQETQTE